MYNVNGIIYIMSNSQHILKTFTNSCVSYAVCRESFRSTMESRTSWQLVWIWETQCKNTSCSLAHRMQRAGDYDSEGSLGSSFCAVSAISVVPVLPRSLPGTNAAHIIPHPWTAWLHWKVCLGDCSHLMSSGQHVEVLANRDVQMPVCESTAHSGWQHMLCFQQHTKYWPWDQTTVISTWFHTFLAQRNTLPFLVLWWQCLRVTHCFTAPWTKGSWDRCMDVMAQAHDGTFIPRLHTLVSGVGDPSQHCAAPVPGPGWGCCPRFPFIGLLFCKVFTPKNLELHFTIKVLLVKGWTAAPSSNTRGSHYTSSLWVHKQCTDCTGITKNSFQVMPVLCHFTPFCHPLYPKTA